MSAEDFLPFHFPNISQRQCWHSFLGTQLAALAVGLGL